VGFQLQPNSQYRIVINSQPLTLKTGVLDADGNVTANFTIPPELEPGFHTLHFYTKNLAGETVDIRKVVYVAASLTDFDGDGVPNTANQCLVMPLSNLDEDKDGVDDACDSDITEAPVVAPPAPEVIPSPEPNPTPTPTPTPNPVPEPTPTPSPTPTPTPDTTTPPQPTDTTITTPSVPDPTSGTATPPSSTPTVDAVIVPSAPTAQPLTTISTTPISAQTAVAPPVAAQVVATPSTIAVPTPSLVAFSLSQPVAVETSEPPIVNGEAIGGLATEIQQSPAPSGAVLSDYVSKSQGTTSVSAVSPQKTIRWMKLLGIATGTAIFALVFVFIIKRRSRNA